MTEVNEQKEFNEEAYRNKVSLICAEIDINKLQSQLTEKDKQIEMLEQGYVWHDYDAGEDCYEDTHEGRWVKRDEVYQLEQANKQIEELQERFKSEHEINAKTNNNLIKQIEELEQTIKTLTRKFNQQSKLIEDYNTTLEKETKQIEELKRGNESLNFALSLSENAHQKKISDLEAQIEKMRNCQNCYRFDTCSLQRPCRNHNEWKLKEQQK